MIPIGDSLPTRRRPWINLLIILVTFLVFFVELGLGSRVDALIYRFGATPALISQALAREPGVPASLLWTLITSQFLHAGWMHLLGNVLFLWVFGDNVEERLGHLRYLLFYLLSGTVAALVQVYSAPESTIPMIGASGAIAGVLGAYLVLWPRAQIAVLLPFFLFLIPLQLPVIFMLGVWFFTQLGSGLAAVTYASNATGGVAFWAHVGGFVFGAIAVMIVPKRQPTPATLPLRATRAGHGSRDYGCAVQAANVLGNIVQLLIGARLVVGLLGIEPDGLLSVLVRLINALSWPLVRPFAHLLPLIRVDGGVLELYALLALVVYHLLLAAIIWALTLPHRQRWN